jgi:alpha-galactosidase
MPTLIPNQTKIVADAIQETQEGLLLSGTRVSVELPAAPKRYLYSGWQSWSLTAWVETERMLRPMRPSGLNSMQTDPAHALDTLPNGAWYGAAQLPDGQVFFLGALGLDSHVYLDGKLLSGEYEDGSGEWFIAQGDETEIFEKYAHLLQERFGTGRIHTSLRVWCSWYSLYTEISAESLLKILNDLGDLPFDVIQVDDGWQTGIGDWEPNAKFPSGMASLATSIQASGRKAGLWLAPLLVVPSSSLYREHRDWLLKDERGRLVSAGFNWGEQLYALDSTHPQVLDWLAALMKKVIRWGYDYVKLDFLYAGALPGRRHVDMPREAAYRHGLEVLRAALGKAYFLTCGAPILPSLGLCDGMRVGPDVANFWTSSRDDVFLGNFAIPGGRNALRTSLHRLWLGSLVHTDPDVTYFRTRQNELTPEQKTLLQDLALVAGFKAASDLPAWLTDSELMAMRKFLEQSPQVQKKSATVYEIDGRLVDFTAYVAIPTDPGPLTNLLGAVVGALGNNPMVMKILNASNLRSLHKMLMKNPV